MAKLYFRYGCMDSSKTSRLLMDAYEYEQRGEKTLLLKPVIDTRSSKGMIESRVGLSASCIDIDSDFRIQEYLAKLLRKTKTLPSCIFVDEAQWLTPLQVVDLRIIADIYDVPSICYGLKLDFKGRLFAGSKALFEHANRCEEVKTICRHENCTNKAMYNARYLNGEFCWDGDIVEVGDTKITQNSYYYKPLCSKHYFEEFSKLNMKRAGK